MNRFPLFIDLTGKTVTVVGGGKIGLRRAEVLLRFGARVAVVSPALDHPVEGIVHLSRPYAAGDLAGAFLAIAAADSTAVNDAVEAEARQRGVWFNRSDDQSRCDFFFPAICEGEGLIAGLVGDGSDHRKTAQAAKCIRKTLEELP